MLEETKIKIIVLALLILIFTAAYLLIHFVTNESEVLEAVNVKYSKIEERRNIVYRDNKRKYSGILPLSTSNENKYNQHDNTSANTENFNDITNFIFETPNYKLLSTIKRDHTIFTQGFLLDTNDTFIESGGLYAKSFLQRSNLNNPLKVIQKLPLDDKYFGEGATLFKNKIYQLTWREGKILIYEYIDNKITYSNTVDLPKTITAGWGITNSDTELIITDGTQNIFFIDPDSFKINRILKAKFSDNTEQSYINELEYINGNIYANIWYKNFIIVINPKTDFSQIVEYERKSIGENKNYDGDCLNGIAYDKYKEM